MIGVPALAMLGAQAPPPARPPGAGPARPPGAGSRGTAPSEAQRRNAPAGRSAPTSLAALRGRGLRPPSTWTPPAPPRPRARWPGPPAPLPEPAPPARRPSRRPTCCSGPPAGRASPATLRDRIRPAAGPGGPWKPHPRQRRRTFGPGRPRAGAPPPRPSGRRWSSSASTAPRTSRSARRWPAPEPCMTRRRCARRRPHGP
mmetsp:Transcript_70612/g.199354  ORF Transcript_70612/g.199354 Transcript_70612/m.199354 type:complete len:201 (+) Transcript_70612:669-1271(+)